MAAVPFQTRQLPKFGKAYMSCKLLPNCTACSEKGTKLPAEQNQLFCRRRSTLASARHRETTQLPTAAANWGHQNFVSGPSLWHSEAHHWYYWYYSQDTGSDSGSIRRGNRQWSQHVFVLTNSSSPIPTYCKSPLIPNPSLCPPLWGKKKGDSQAWDFVNHHEASSRL